MAEPCLRHRAILQPFSWPILGFGCSQLAPVTLLGNLESAAGKVLLPGPLSLGLHLSSSPWPVPMYAAADLHLTASGSASSPSALALQRGSRPRPPRAEATASREAAAEGSTLNAEGTSSVPTSAEKPEKNFKKPFYMVSLPSLHRSACLCPQLMSTNMQSVVELHGSFNL